VACSHCSHPTRLTVTTPQISAALRIAAATRHTFPDRQVHRSSNTPATVRTLWGRGGHGTAGVGVLATLNAECDNVRATRDRPRCGIRTSPDQLHHRFFFRGSPTRPEHACPPPSRNRWTTAPECPILPRAQGLAGPPQSPDASGKSSFRPQPRRRSQNDRLAFCRISLALVAAARPGPARRHYPQIGARARPHKRRPKGVTCSTVCLGRSTTGPPEHQLVIRLRRTPECIDYLPADFAPGPVWRGAHPRSHDPSRHHAVSRADHSLLDLSVRLGLSCRQRFTAHRWSAQ